MNGGSKYREMLLTAAQTLKIELPPRKVFLSPWLLGQTITLITGFRGIGKTWFGLGIGKAVSTGGTFGPWECRDPGRVMYIDGELPLVDMQDRIRGMGLEPENERLLFYLDSIAELNDYARPNLADPEWRENMLTVLTREVIDLVIYDNISALTPGTKENDAEAWDPIAEFLKTCRHRGVSSILLHHPGKSGDQRGTSKREDIISNSIVLKYPADYMKDQGARFHVEFTKARVPNADLKLITTREVQVIQDGGGRYAYRWTDPQRAADVLVLRLLNEGISQKDIADNLGVTSGRVSQMKSDFIKRGLLKCKGRELILTGKGSEFLLQNDPTFGTGGCDF